MKDSKDAQFSTYACSRNTKATKFSIEKKSYLPSNFACYTICFNGIQWQNGKEITKFTTSNWFIYVTSQVLMDRIQFN